MNAEGRAPRGPSRLAHDELQGFLITALKDVGYTVQFEYPVKCDWGVGFVDVLATLDGEQWILFEVKSESERHAMGQAVRQIRQYRKALKREQRGKRLADVSWVYTDQVLGEGAIRLLNADGIGYALYDRDANGETSLEFLEPVRALEAVGA